MIWSQADDPTAGGRFRSLKASPWPFDQCWNRGLQTVDAARCCVSPLSGNQSVWVGDDCFHLQPPFYVKLLLEKRVDPVLGWCIFTYTCFKSETLFKHKPPSHQAGSLRPKEPKKQDWVHPKCHLAQRILIFIRCHILLRLCWILKMLQNVEQGKRKPQVC